jgi:hypothetical protein
LKGRKLRQPSLRGFLDDPPVGPKFYKDGGPILCVRVPAAYAAKP